MSKTNQEKLVAARALVAKLEQAVNAEAILNNVNVGNKVRFAFGRGEKRRELDGTVVAVREDEKQGKLARINSGEGFEQQGFTVRVADIVENYDAPQAEGTEEASSDEAPASDPLAAE
jgi:hypothetical protein